jgi:multidrug efflux system outer membrane protein
MTSIRKFAALFLAAALAGCTVTQPKPPTLDLPEPTASPAQNELLEQWWVAFDDPVLTDLIKEAYANNLDLKAALARIALARSNVLLADSNLYPTVSANAGATRSRLSQIIVPPSDPPTTPSVTNDLSIGLQVSYEIDVWGKYRAGSLAAANDLVAAQYDREAVRITVSATVARTYFQLRAADALLAVYVETQKSRADTVQLQRDRFEGGLIGEYDLRQAEAELYAVLADIARAQQAISLLESALATLTGRSPRDVFKPTITRGASIDAATSVPRLPEGLPSGLMQRRPDIKRSEADLAAADLRIQQARTNYFPAISLTGAYGFEGTSLANLFTGPAAAWSLGLALVQPLFSLKNIEAGVQAAEARKEAATVQYQQIVQNAFREVHDALSTNDSSQRVLAAESARREQLKQALAVANLRYDAGRTSYLEVLDAQRTLLASETLRIAAARDARGSIVDFAKALGGGWQTDSVTPVQ